MFEDVDCTAVASSMARIAAAAEAAGLVAVAELALRRRSEGGRRGLSDDECDEYTADEVGALLQMSRTAARARLVLALDLSGHRPATLAALTRGDICLARARRISEALAVLDDDVARPVEVEALRLAPEQTPARLTARLTRLVLRADADAARRRCEAAVRERRCSIRVLHDGTALLQVLGRTELVVAAFERIDAVARSLVRHSPAADDDHGAAAAGEPVAPPGRLLDQTRADVLLSLLVGDPDTMSGGVGVSVSIDVVAPAGTLLGGDAPGELVGYGPVPADVVRELAEDAAWRRWVTDADGAVVARSTRRYRPGAAMVQLLRARDGTCRFPTCGRRASACDVDHVVPWPAGPTHVDNLAVLCRHHHRLKHRGAGTCARTRTAPCAGAPLPARSTSACRGGSTAWCRTPGRPRAGLRTPSGSEVTPSPTRRSTPRRSRSSGVGEPATHRGRSGSAQRGAGRPTYRGRSFRSGWARLHSFMRLGYPVTPAS